MNFIKNLITDDFNINLKKIKEKHFSDKNINISVWSIQRSIKDFEYTFKKVDIVPQARNMKIMYKNDMITLEKL